MLSASPLFNGSGMVTVGVKIFSYKNKTEEKGKQYTNSSRTKPSVVQKPKSEFSSSAFDCFGKKQIERGKRIYTNKERERKKEKPFWTTTNVSIRRRL